MSQRAATGSRPQANAEKAVATKGVSIALACRAFGVCETCFRFSPKCDKENAMIADLLVGLTNVHKTWGFGLCFLHLRNVKGHVWNHKRVHRIYCELELNLRSEAKSNPSDIFRRGITLRRFRSVDAFRPHPAPLSVQKLRKNADKTPMLKEDGSEWWIWSASNGRMSSLFVSGTDGLLIEEAFSHHAGWAEGYAYDERPDRPHPPSDKSHGFYLQYSCWDVTCRGLLLLEAAMSGMQFRPGGILEDFVVAGCNSGIMSGNGIKSNDGLDDADPDTYDGGQSVAGSWNFISDGLITMTGQKDTLFSNMPILSGGIGNTAHRAVMRRIARSHRDGRLPTGDDDIGPVGRALTGSEAFGLKPEAEGTGSMALRDVSVYNYAPLSGKVPNAVKSTTSPAALETARLDIWLDNKLGISGSTLQSIAAYLRAQANPAALVPEMLDAILPAHGYARPARRTVGTTVRFVPTGPFTPGIRADIREDWLTRDLPGTTPGDTIDADGHRIHWAINPDHPIVDLDLGGGALIMWGGDLALLGRITSGGDIALRYRSSLWTDGYSGTSQLVVALGDGGRFVNTGTIAGHTSRAVRGKVGSATEGGPEVVLAYGNESYG